MKTKKVTFFISELDIGGAEKQLLLILPELKKHFAIHVICALGHGPIGISLAQQNIPVHYLNLASRFDIRIIWRLYKIFKKIQPDTLVTMLIFADITGRLLGRLSGVKQVITSHRSSLIGRDYLRLAYYLSDWLVDNDIVQSQAAKKYHPTATIIPNTVNFSPPYEGGVPANAGEGVKIICVANLKPGKGHEYLLKALSRTGEGGEVLLLAGTGPLENQLKQLALDLGISNQVKFLGLRSDIPNLLQQSDIFVLPTEGEGMSNAVLEAMAMGLPVITSDIPVNQEVIQHQKTGLLFKNKNVADLTDKLNQLITNPNLRATLAQNAREYIKNNHSIAAIIPQWIKILSP